MVRIPPTPALERDVSAARGPIAITIVFRETYAPAIWSFTSIQLVLRRGRNLFPSRVPKGFIGPLFRYRLHFKLVDRNIYDCLFSGFDDHILKRVATGNRKLTIVFVFIKPGNMRRSYAEPISAGIQPHSIHAVGTTTCAFPFSGDLIGGNRHCPSNRRSGNGANTALNTSRALALH